jgi:prevent-host-death family protein
MAPSVTVRELRNDGGRVLRRVERGEAITVTRDGEPVAELCPLPRPALTPDALVRAWAPAPPIDLGTLRADLDTVVDTQLW